MASIPYQRIGGQTIGGQSGGLPATFSTGDLVKNGLLYAPVGNRPNLYYFDDFLFVTNVNYYIAATTGSVGGSFITPPSGAGVGYLGINTGGSATGGAAVVQGYGALPGLFKSFRTRYGFWLPVLSNATDTYVMHIGISSTSTLAPTRPTAYLTYTHGTNSGKFQLLTGPAGSQTTADTGVTVAANTFYVLDISCTVTAPNTTTNASTWALFAGGTQVANGTANLNAATSANNTETGMLQASIIKSAGTTGASVQVDFFECFGTYS